MSGGRSSAAARASASTTSRAFRTARSASEYVRLPLALPRSQAAMARSPNTRQNLATHPPCKPRSRLELLRREDGASTLRQLPDLAEREGAASPANSNAAWPHSPALFTPIAGETQMHHFDARQIGVL